MKLAVHVSGNLGQLPASGQQEAWPWVLQLQENKFCQQTTRVSLEGDYSLIMPPDENTVQLTL